jgi:hypothetical protein
MHLEGAYYFGGFDVDTISEDTLIFGLASDFEPGCTRCFNVKNTSTLTWAGLTYEKVLC